MTCDKNKVILLLQKGVCPYMDDWQKIKETSLSEKEGFSVT